MDSVNAWLGLALGVIGVLAGVGAMLRWTGLWILRTFNDRIDAKLEATLDSKFDAAFSAELAPIARRLDRLEVKVDNLGAKVDRLDVKVDVLDVKVDHVSEVVDLRLKPIEADMLLVKQHLLGHPAV